MANNRTMKLRSFVDGITGEIPPIAVCKDIDESGLFFLSNAVVENIKGYKSDLFADYGIFLDSSGVWKCWFAQYFLYDDIRTIDPSDSFSELKSFCLVSDSISAFKDLGNAFIALSDKSKYKVTGYKYLIASQSDSLIYALQDSSNATKASRSSFAIYFQSKTNSIFVAESVNKALKKVDLSKSIYNVFDDNTITVYPFMDCFITAVTNLYSKIGKDIVSVCDKIINGDAEPVQPFDYSTEMDRLK